MMNKIVILFATVKTSVLQLQHHLPLYHVKHNIAFAYVSKGLTPFPPAVRWFVPQYNSCQVPVQCLWQQQLPCCTSALQLYFISSFWCLIIFIIIVTQSVQQLDHGLGGRGLVVRFLGGWEFLLLPTISRPTLGPPNLISKCRIFFLCV